jgi:hypothetical protein
LQNQRNVFLVEDKTWFTSKSGTIKEKPSSSYPERIAKSTKHFKNFGNTDMFSLLIYVIKRVHSFQCHFMKLQIPLLGTPIKYDCQAFKGEKNYPF